MFAAEEKNLQQEGGCSYLRMERLFRQGNGP
jgi:hypothetical protein